MKLVSMYAVMLLVATTTPAVALNNKEVVHFVQKLLDNLPPIDLPPVATSKLDLFANATNIQVTNLGLTDLSLSIPDDGHMMFTLSGMTGTLGMHLAAGINLPPIKRSWNVTGKMADLDLKITFAVAAGNAVMSDVSVNLGSLSVNFGSDALANLLAKLFTPVLRTAVNHLLPPVVLTFKHMLDFQHFINLMLTAFSKAPLPNTTMSLNEYKVELLDITVATPHTKNQSFAIEGDHLVFDMGGLTGAGSMVIKYGKGEDLSTTEAQLGLFKTCIKVVTKVTQNKDGSFGLDYVSAEQNIGQLEVVSSSTDPLVKFLVSSMQSFMKSFLEEGFQFLVKAFLSL